MGYKLNPDDAALDGALDSAYMEHECLEAAKRIKAFAEFSSPVVTGEYIEGWETNSGHGTGGPAWARVYNEVEHSWYVERGNSTGAPAQHILRKAGETWEAFQHE